MVRWRTDSIMFSGMVSFAEWRGICCKIAWKYLLYSLLQPTPSILFSSISIIIIFFLFSFWHLPICVNVYWTWGFDPSIPSSSAIERILNLTDHWGCRGLLIQDFNQICPLKDLLSHSISLLFYQNTPPVHIHFLVLRFCLLLLYFHGSML